MPVETIVTEAAARALLDTGSEMNEAAFMGLIDYVGRKSVVEVLDVMTTAEITASLTDAGVSADAIWTKALEKLGSGGAIRFPAGRFNFTSTIHLNRRLHIMGQGFQQQGGDLTTRPTTLTFPADTHGIVVHRYNTSSAQDGAIEGADPNGPRGDSSILSGLHLIGGGGTSGHGIWLRARATVEDCRVSGFGGNGLNIVASVVGTGVAYGNANDWIVRDTSLVANLGHGMYVDGADANAGVGIAINASSNRKSGIYESSFLGNCYIGCHTATNGTLARCFNSGRYFHATTAVDSTTEPTPGMNWKDGDPWQDISAGVVQSIYPQWVSGTAYEYNSGYVTPAFPPDNSFSARNCFVGCYSESDQPQQVMNDNCLILGGLQAANIRGGMFIDGTNVYNAMNFRSREDDTEANISFAIRSATDQLYRATFTGDHPQGLAFGINTNNNYAYFHSNLAIRQGLAFKSDASLETYGGNAARVISGTPQLPMGVVFGGGSTARKVTQGTTAPADALRGDIHYYVDHTAGGWIGAACVTSATGDPLSGAVWKNFGAIEA